MSKRKLYGRWKKPAALLLLLLFFLGTTGFTVSIHQCPIKGTSASFFNANKCVCPTPDTDGCCKDLVKLLKVRGKCFHQEESPLLLKPVFLSHIQLYNVLFLALNIEAASPFFYAYTHPPVNFPTIFILDRALLI